MQKYYKFLCEKDTKFNGWYFEKGKEYYARWSKKNNMFFFMYLKCYTTLTNHRCSDSELIKTAKRRNFKFLGNVFFKSYQPRGEEIHPPSKGRNQIGIRPKKLPIPHVCDKVKIGNKKWSVMLKLNEECPVCSHRFTEWEYYKNTK